MKAVRLLGALVALVPAAHAADASAGTLTASRAGGVVTVQTTAAAAREEVQMRIRGGLMSFSGRSFTDVDAGPGCSEAAVATDVTCGTGVTVSRIVLRPGGGDDFFSTRGQTGDVEDVQAEIDADMGPGDDILAVRENSQPVSATGGEGSDNIFSGPAVDRLEGGPGADALGGGLGSDELLGGDDFDDAFYTDHDGDLVLDLDGVRDDGDPALGEADLLAGIESLTGGDGDDVITGDGGLNDLTGGQGADRIDGGGGFDRFDGGAGSDTLLARDGLAETIGCADGADQAVTDDVDLTFGCEDRRSAPDLQPDRDGDGTDKPLDCDDLDGTVRPGAFDRPGDGIDQDCDGADAVDRDRDRDGFPAGADCDDGSRAVHPGAVDVPGNTTDEDCDGTPEPFAAFATVALLSTRNGALTEVVGLVLVDLDGGERVTLRCTGAGCRFRSRARRAGARAESLILDKQVRGQRLRPRTRLSVAIRRADGVTKTVSFIARRGKPPRQRTRCSGGRVARC